MEILLIADDLTGALDSAVPLISAGVDVRVRYAEDDDIAARTSAASVLVVNADTRHLAPHQAYGRVRRLVEQGLRAGARIVVKKTDSALRGNIGSELAGMLDGAGSGHTLMFAPALPDMDRVTRRGVQYIDGVPVERSPFGADPFEPVSTSRVADIIAIQAPQVRTREFSVTEPVENFGGIAICDAEVDEDLMIRCAEAMQMGEPVLMAGCAGLTKALGATLTDCATPAGASATCAGNLLVMCGSVNAASRAQCAYARREGWPVFDLDVASKFYPEWVEGEACAELKRQVWESWDASELTVIDSGDRFSLSELPGVTCTDTPDEMRERVSGNLGRILAELTRGRGDCTVFAMGGDVLLAYLTALGVDELSMVAEVAPGVVMSSFSSAGAHINVISKSGGFGEEDLFVSLAHNLAANNEKERMSVAC